VYILPPTSWKTLNIIALNDDMFDLWVKTLHTLVSDIKQVSLFRMDKSSDLPISAESPPSQLNPDVSIGKSGIIGILGTKDGSTPACGSLGTKDGSTPACGSRTAGLSEPVNPPPRAHRTFSELEEQNAEKMVTLPEVLSMCRKIGISQKVGHSNPSSASGITSAQQDTHDNIGLIEMYFRSIDQDRRGILDFEQFRAIVKMIRANPDITDFWRKLSSTDDSTGERGITLQTFSQWLRVHQGVSGSSVTMHLELLLKMYHFAVASYE
jgi:hypothetical protein